MADARNFGTRFGSGGLCSAEYHGGIHVWVSSRMKYGKKCLVTKALDGNKTARARLIGQKQSAWLGYKRQSIPKEQVPKGITRMTKRDPDTGELHTVDLPGTIGVFKMLLRRIDGEQFGVVSKKGRSDQKSRRRVAHKLKPWQIEFLMTGRYRPPLDANR